MQEPCYLVIRSQGRVENQGRDIAYGNYGDDLRAEEYISESLCSFQFPGAEEKSERQAEDIGAYQRDGEEDKIILNRIEKLDAKGLVAKQQRKVLPTHVLVEKSGDRFIESDSKAQDDGKDKESRVNEQCREQKEYNESPVFPTHD
jgi:hypothetical protein